MIPLKRVVFRSNSSKQLLVIVLIACCLLDAFRYGPAWCANPIDDLLNPPSPLTENERATLGVTGLSQAQFLPEAEIEAYAKSKGVGTAKGAAEGFLSAMAHMGNCSGDFCGLAIIIWAATAGTVGTVYGAIQGYRDSMSEAEAERAWKSLETLYINLKLQEILSRKIANAARKTGKSLIAITGYGPKASGEMIDYRLLNDLRVDSVLESSVISFGFKTWPQELQKPNHIYSGNDPSISLFVNTRPRVIRLSDNKVLYQTRRDVMSEYRRSSEWEADKFKVFSEELDRLMERIAVAIVEDVFITYVLPEETPP